MTPFNLWMALPPVVSAIAVLTLLPRKLRHAVYRSLISAACAGLFVVPALDRVDLLPVSWWLANPVSSVEGLQAVFRLDLTWNRAALLGLAALSLASSVYRLDAHVSWTAVLGMAIQALGAGLALLSGDMLTTVLLWQVLDMGRWMWRGHAVLWEVLGSLALLFGAVQLSSASGTAVWEGLRPSALHPTWGWLLMVGLGLRLHLFPAMLGSETLEGKHDWTPFANVSALAVAFAFADNLLRSGLNVVGPLGPWAVLSVLVLLLGWAGVGGSAPDGRSWAMTIVACGSAMLITWNSGDITYVLLGAAATAYVVSATIDRPSVWLLGTAAASGLVTMALAMSAGLDTFALAAALAMGFAGLASLSAARGPIGIGGLVVLTASIAVLILATADQATEQGMPLGALMAGLALAWVLLGVAAAGSLRVTVRARIRGRGAFDGAVSDHAAVLERGRWLALLPDGSGLENGVRRGLERLSVAIEHRSGALGDELAMTWIVVVGVLVFMLLLR